MGNIHTVVTQRFLGWRHETSSFWSKGSALLHVNALYSMNSLHAVRVKIRALNHGAQTLDANQASGVQLSSSSTCVGYSARQPAGVQSTTCSAKEVQACACCASRSGLVASKRSFSTASIVQSLWLTLKIATSLVCRVQGSKAAKCCAHCFDYASSLSSLSSHSKPSSDSRHSSYRRHRRRPLQAAHRQLGLPPSVQTRHTAAALQVASM